MKPDLGSLMKQAQKIQADMQKAQEELGQLEVSGEAGGGMISIVMSGRHEVRQVKIADESLLSDREMLEDLIAAAANDAIRKVEEATRDKLSGFAGGMGLPGGLKLPF